MTKLLIITAFISCLALNSLAVYGKSPKSIEMTKNINTETVSTSNKDPSVSARNEQPEGPINTFGRRQTDQSSYDSERITETMALPNYGLNQNNFDYLDWPSSTLNSRGSNNQNKMQQHQKGQVAPSDGLLNLNALLAAVPPQLRGTVGGLLQTLTQQVQNLVPPTQNQRPQSVPNVMPNRMPNGMPSGIPSGIPSGMPNGMPSGMPSGVPNGMQQQQLLPSLDGLLNLNGLLGALPPPLRNTVGGLLQTLGLSSNQQRASNNMENQQQQQQLLPSLDSLLDLNGLLNGLLPQTNYRRRA